MRKSWLLFLAAHCIVTSAQAEPTFKGRPLSAWFQEFLNAKVTYGESECPGLEGESRKALKTIGQPAADLLLPLLQDADCETALRAAFQIGDMTPDTAPVRRILEAKDATPLARAAAAMVLAAAVPASRHSIAKTIIAGLAHCSPAPFREFTLLSARKWSGDAEAVEEWNWQEKLEKHHLQLVLHGFDRKWTDVDEAKRTRWQVKHHRLTAEPTTAADKKSCFKNQKTILDAVKMYEFDQKVKISALTIEVLEAMRKGGYLMFIPTDPGGGGMSALNYSITSPPDRVVQCAVHGRSP